MKPRIGGLAKQHKDQIRFFKMKTISDKQKIKLIKEIKAEQPKYL